MRPGRKTLGKDIQAIMGYGILVTPALVIDDEAMASGRIPPAAEIAGWIKEAGAPA